MVKKHNPFSAWLETATAMNAASTTIAIRTMRIQAAMLAGDSSGGPEAKTMVAEKMKAAADGYAAAVAASPFLWSARSGPAWWDAAAKVGMAAAGPGMKKARANAKRLSGAPAKKRKTKKR